MVNLSTCLWYFLFLSSKIWKIYILFILEYRSFVSSGVFFPRYFILFYMVVSGIVSGFVGGTSSKKPIHQCRRHKRQGSIPGLGGSPGGGTATHSSILGWTFPWTEELGRLKSMGSQRVRHDWSNLGWMHGIVSLIALSDLLFLVHRNIIGFCVLILYPENLLNLLIKSSSFLVSSLEFSIYSIMSSSNS